MNTHGFVNRHHIRASVDWADSNPNMTDDKWSRDANHWRVTLRMGRKRLTVPFSTGSALGEPEADDVLDCLASDAQSFIYARDFEDWASELGYDTDSRSALRTYESIVRQSSKLRRFLGDALYETLTSEVERL